MRKEGGRVTECGTRQKKGETKKQEKPMKSEEKATVAEVSL